MRNGARAQDRGGNRKTSVEVFKPLRRKQRTRKKLHVAEYEEQECRGRDHPEYEIVLLSGPRHCKTARIVKCPCRQALKFSCMQPDVWNLVFWKTHLAICWNIPFADLYKKQDRRLHGSKPISQGRHEQRECINREGRRGGR
jgi:hypothetical protein